MTSTVSNKRMIAIRARRNASNAVASFGAVMRAPKSSICRSSGDAKSNLSAWIAAASASIASNAEWRNLGGPSQRTRLLERHEVGHHPEGPQDGGETDEDAEEAAKPDDRDSDTVRGDDPLRVHGLRGSSHHLHA